MNYVQFQANSGIISSLVPYLSSYINMPLLYLWPRPDYAQDILRFEPQLYIIRPAVDIVVSCETKGTLFPIVDSVNGTRNYNTYNLYSEPCIYSCSKAVIMSLRDSALESVLQKIGLNPSFLEIQAASVFFQLEERIKNSVPFTVFSNKTQMLNLVKLKVKNIPHKFKNQAWLSFEFSEIYRVQGETRYDEI